MEVVAVGFKIPSRNFSCATEKNHEISHSGQSPDLDLNPGPPECEPGILSGQTFGDCFY
jgi:hypothetical protein